MRSYGWSSASYWARVLCFFLAGWCCFLGAQPLYAQNSTEPSSTQLTPEQAWLVLFPALRALPIAIDSLESKALAEIASLQQTVELLRTSNGSLESSNAQLTQQNADLRASQEASKAALAISESSRQTSEQQLKLSTAQVTEALGHLDGADAQVKQAELEKALGWIAAAVLLVADLVLTAALVLK